ncbi:MAG: hypothetical protein K9K88_01595 [Desulfobacterales bacterium]|nr:hypothetical protein [Desulfobacterales bacterium]
MEQTTKSYDNSGNDFPYFRRIWVRVVLTLLAASFIPLLVIGGGLYFFAASALKAKAIESVQLEMVQRRLSIDRFFEERVLDLQQLADRLEPWPTADSKVMEAGLNSLNQGTPFFSDLGIIDGHGRHRAYAGPYRLEDKNYLSAPWFREVIAEGVHISDVFLGFRNEPHLIIAIRKNSFEGPWVLRATLNFSLFDELASSVPGERRGEAYLINAEGYFQSRPRSAGRLMARSPIDHIAYFEGVRWMESGNDILFMTWQDRVAWLNVVQLKSAEIYRDLHRARVVVFLVFVLAAILILGCVLLTTNSLIARLEAERRSLGILGQQLRRTSYLASSMELSLGFFQEAKETFSNIDLAATILEEQIQNESNQEAGEELAQIRGEVIRGKSAVERLLRYIRPEAPLLQPVDVEEVIDDLFGILDRELRFRSIEVEKDFPPDMPKVNTDRSKLRQVFQNIVLNAVDAVDRNGHLRVIADLLPNTVAVRIEDDGPGIAESDMEKIFEPLWTTRHQGTGLGLPICRDILTKLGGRISVSSVRGRGTTVTVELPRS